MYVHIFVSKVLLDIALEKKPHKTCHFSEIPYEEHIISVDCVLELPFESWKSSLVVLMRIFKLKKIDDLFNPDT